MDQCCVCDLNDSCFEHLDIFGDLIEFLSFISICDVGSKNEENLYEFIYWPYFNVILHYNKMSFFL